MLYATGAGELLVGLADMAVLEIEAPLVGRLVITVETQGRRPSCPGCGGPVWVKNRPLVELVDLPGFGWPVRLRWRKHRWCCPAAVVPGRVFHR